MRVFQQVGTEHRTIIHLLHVGQSCITNSSFAWLGSVRVFKDVEGACTPAVTTTPCSLAWRTLHSWLSQLCLWAQVPGGDLNMKAGLLSVSGRMKPAVSLWFSLTPSSRCNTKSRLY